MCIRDSFPFVSDDSKSDTSEINPNNFSKTKRVILDDNQRIVEEISDVEVLGELPGSDNMEMLKNRFKAIGDKIGSQRLD